MRSVLHFGSFGDFEFANQLSSLLKSRKSLILVDENTHEHCLGYLMMHVDDLSGVEILELPSGEENKTLAFCEPVWETLTEFNFSRNDLLIVLGGGVLCDMGGFIAGLYKRGIACVYIPTTLLSMVDASVGGKTGVDMGAYKNHLGVFKEPQAVFFDLQFLSTLSEREKRNGLAEMIKHSLISGDRVQFATLTSPAILDNMDVKTIQESVVIKEEIVQADLYETGLRKVLNLGHTVAHAIEGYCLSNHKMDHGLAVAHGLAIELMLSGEVGLIKQEIKLEIFEKLEPLFEWRNFTAQEIEKMIPLMNHDKKNKGSQPEFVLLCDFGKYELNQKIEMSLVQKCMNLFLVEGKFL